MKAKQLQKEGRKQQLKEMSCAYSILYAAKAHFTLKPYAMQCPTQDCNVLPKIVPDQATWARPTTVKMSPIYYIKLHASIYPFYGLCL